MPALAREPCRGADLPKPPIGEPAYQEFSLLEAGWLEICDYKRMLAVAGGDLTNYRADYITANLRAPTLIERVTGRRKMPEAPPMTIEDILDREAGRGRY